MSGIEMDGKIQWHPGFVAAMNLEFEENREDLFFEDEYKSPEDSLSVDTLYKVLAYAAL